MKKIVLCAVIMAFGLSSLCAQEVKFGAKAGVDFASIKTKGGAYGITVSETGFYAGGFAEIDVFNALAFRPEVLYVSIDKFDQINVPLMAKYSVTEALDVLAGPVLGLLLNPAEGRKSFNYGIETGAAYNITEKLFIEARYNLGIANLLENAPSGFSNKISGFFVGVGYRIR